MESYLYPDHYDLITPDGVVTQLTRVSEEEMEATLYISAISPVFRGFYIDPEHVVFNLKSTLAQLGVEGRCLEMSLDREHCTAEVRIRLTTVGSIAVACLDFLSEGARIGKLFAADPYRRVRDPDYLSRMFGRSDRNGKPLLSLGGMQGAGDLLLDKVDGRTVAYLSLQNGRIDYEPSILGFLPTLGASLSKGIPIRHLLSLHQSWRENAVRHVQEGELLLVRTLPLHVRTVFGRVVEELLTEGYQHTSASILQPDTKASGDIYELYGDSKREITDIPLEFYTLEPHREHVFFEDRDQLQYCLENETCLFKAFQTAPEPAEDPAAIFVVKGKQLVNLRANDWITRNPLKQDFPGLGQAGRQAHLVERYIVQQPEYPFLRAIEDNLITSQGILLSRYFPTPLMKRMLLSRQVQRCLKGIYFRFPSSSGGNFFSHEDHALLNDLVKFAIPAFWVDEVTGKVLQYIQKPDHDSGMFVPKKQVNDFLSATVFGVYGSNLLEGSFEEELYRLLVGLQDMKEEMSHPLLNPDTPLALVTGGGPGAMEVGNRVAKNLNILSCGRVVDFTQKDGTVVNEQLQNPHVEAKMTYRLDKLVERQAEFNLDFPIFLMGGIGTDFEFSLEEVRRKVGTVPPRPILLLGETDYWKQKISSRFQVNMRTGTIAGSEWISNCFYCVQSAEQGLAVYRSYFQGQLAIGKEGPVYEEGFVADFSLVQK